MNPLWNKFIQQYKFANIASDNNAPSLTALNQFGVLTISGSDAADFLQGQTTCDIKKLKDNKPQLGAYCNAKGRTISTFIIIKKFDNMFYLVLSVDLITRVQKKLQMYVLRADVTLINQSESLCILGLDNQQLESQEHLYPYLNEKTRSLFIADINSCKQLFTALTQNKTVQLINANAWSGADILARIPWLNSSTTELFIPQMINLDKLGAINFEKGCYTGQEVIARTHYLGKNKRIMLTAICHLNVQLPDACTISDPSNTETILGTVLSSSQQKNSTLLLVVLKEEPTTADNLQLNNENIDTITLVLKP
jgi:folate-binding protein YgfZ